MFLFRTPMVTATAQLWRAPIDRVICIMQRSRGSLAVLILAARQQQKEQNVRTRESSRFELLLCLG